MQPLSQNFEVSRNADWAFAFQLNLNGAPIDLTGCTLNMDLADPNGRKSLKLAIGNGFTVAAPTTGTVKLYVPWSRLFGLPPQTYTHDLLITRTDGTRWRYWTGTVQVDNGVTNV